MEIKRIMCCCGQGLGSSMIVSMNVERVLKKLGITGVSCGHTALSEISENSADLFVVGKDLAPQVSHFKKPIIVLDQLMNMGEIETKIKGAFGLE